MKTSLQWHKQFLDNSASYVSKAAIEQIQLDAAQWGYEQGKKRAAEVAKNAMYSPIINEAIAADTNQITKEMLP